MAAVGTGSRWRAARALIAAGLLAIACGPRDDGGAVADAPVAIEDQEDAVCGMLVRDQSAPRAQLVHRDGERAFFCSIGDLLVHLAAPSPHGPARAVFVEAMRADEDPGASHTGPHPWLPAEAAAYVVGVERSGIMGAPVLVYADDAVARRVAAGRPDARVLDFDGLQRWWRERQAAR
jgi:nitrous oxide reductase accessory protein NosL